MINTIRKECIQIGTDSDSKEDILREIAALAGRCPILQGISEQDIFEALAAREEVHSTGLAEGIAIPHCSFDSIDDFVVGLILVPGGIEFNSMDGKKSRFIFFIIGPKTHRNRHVKILSSISLLSKDMGKLEKLANRTSPEGVLQVLQGEEDVAQIPEKTRERCQMTVFLQDEDLFDDILEVLTSDTEGAVMVLEAVNAGYYLHRLPLFSSFWNESDRSWGRIIMSVIDKQLANETIRRINMVRKKEGPGLLVTVQDLVFAEGTLNF